MELILAVVALLVLAGGAYWWFGRRRTPPPEEDEWTLPLENGARGPVQELGPQLLDRESLLHRDRRFDPTNWDDGPDEAGDASEQDSPADEAEDLPKYFDRDFLQRRREESPGG